MAIVNKISKPNRAVTFSLIAAMLFIAIFDQWIMQSSLFRQNEQALMIGIALDFTVALPLLLYFAIYRRISKKIVAVIPFMLLGLAALHFYLPASSHDLPTILKFVIIPLELLLLSYSFYKLTAAYRAARRNLPNGVHPLEALKKSIRTSISNQKIAAFLQHECSMIYYAFLSWGKKPYQEPGTSAYSYHKESGWFIAVLAFSKILLFEGIIIHILVMNWSHPAAWLLSVGNLYFIILLISDYRAMKLNPAIVSERGLVLRYGVQLTAELAWSNIASIEAVPYKAPDKQQMKASFIPIGFEGNVLIRLKQKTRVVKIFGVTQEVEQLYLFIDQPHPFVKQCSEHVKPASQQG